MYNTYDIFINVIENLKKNKNVKSIIHVGSSKDKIKDTNCQINDIDLFIIVEKQKENQIRKVEKINNIEFDFNYISIDGSYQFIENMSFLRGKLRFPGHGLYREYHLGLFHHAPKLPFPQENPVFQPGQHQIKLVRRQHQEKPANLGQLVPVLRWYQFDGAKADRAAPDLF